MPPAQLRAPAEVRVVWDGQSYLLAPTVGRKVPEQAMAGTGIPHAVVAVNGQGWVNLTPTAAARVRPQARSGLDVLVMFGGLSDVIGGYTGTQSYDLAVDYKDQAVGWGFDATIMCTWPAVGPNAAGTGFPDAGDQDEIDTYNALVLANTGGWDAVVDMSDDPRMNDATDLTYWHPDRLHFTEAGSGVAAALIRPVLLDVIDSLTP